MSNSNDSTRAAEIVNALLQDSRFNFTDQRGYLRKGVCPDCGKKELYVRKSEPWRVACGRENKCGSSWTAKELLPHLYENYVKRFPPTPENPKATADAYLTQDRGFNLTRCRSWYDQEGHRLKESGEFVPTVRFYLDKERTRYWERLIGKTKADGQKAHIGGKRKSDGSLFRGDAWTPPGQELKEGDECYITEGIFHAIALEHAGKKVAAAISSVNFPSNLIESNKEKDIKWILALDSDKAGRRYMVKHRKALLKVEEEVEIALLPNSQKDWDDLWQESKLDEKFFEECLYQGTLFTAESVEEKCWRIFCKYPTKIHHVIDFRNAIYSVKIGSKFSAELIEIGIDLESEDGFEMFKTHCSVDMICNVSPTFLYMEKEELLDEQKYIFQIDYKNGTPSKIMGLEGTSLTSGDAFHKALLNNTNGGRYTGDNRAFAMLTKKWLDNRMLEVQSIPFVGYEKKSKSYVFHDNAFQSGRKVTLNEHGYFELKNIGIKTSLGAVAMKTDGEFSPDWLSDYIRAFHYQGIAVLAFWLGTLFVQQIREKQKSFPFLEFTGEPGSGKTTALEFCWKLVGRDDNEGFDIAKSTPAGRRRAFNQVSNLPIVIIESDRDRGDNEKRPQQFDFDECKAFYNGRSTGTLGVATRGNDIDEQPFKASLLISQNAEVDGSQALLERIVHCHMDKKHHGEGSVEIARWFEMQSAETVGGFLGVALQNEKRIMDTYLAAFKKLEPRFAKCGITTKRIRKTHAQIAACAQALTVIFPNLEQNTIDRFFLYLENRANSREERIKADHPMIEKFWETYHYINDKSRDSNVLDHSDQEKEIGINLNSFREHCIQYGQELIDLTQLKKVLPTSKRHKFIAKNRAVWSKHLQKTIRCWFFQR
ncbi:MAG: toprim domain-containing protein [Desulforhopalus sp.]